MHPPNETEEMARGERKEYVKYETVIETIRSTGAKVVEVDALELAYDAGNPLTVNVVMVGALSGLPDFPVKKDAMLGAVKSTVPPKALETNVKAFENGFRVCSNAECFE